MTLNGRDHRIDFFRGLALIFIFWDHIPHNPLAEFTVRNFGFSDAAEIFVFLAGYAAVLAYGKIARRDGFLLASVKILRRAWVATSVPRWWNSPDFRSKGRCAKSSMLKRAA